MIAEVTPSKTWRFRVMNTPMVAPVVAVLEGPNVARYNRGMRSESLSRGETMLKITTGVIHEKTIELDEPLDLTDGQRVEIVVRSPQEAAIDEDAMRRCAGLLADMPDSVDSDLQTILDSRKEVRFREASP